jgi:ABC-type nitrate/sulfonate/bicarbonate transport system substrate-binding protein
MAAKEGYRLLVDLAPLDVAYMRNVVAVSERMLREDPRQVTRFVEAFSEGMRFYRNNANKDECMRILAKYLRLPLDKQRAAVEEGYETYRDVMLRKPYPDPNAMKLQLELVAEANPKAKALNLATLVDASFVEKLDRDGVLDK